MAGGQGLGGTGLMLDPVPMAKGRSRYFLILGCGVCSTMLALGAAYALQRYGNMHIMGLYGGWIPVGAVFVGLGASAGYALMSRACGLKLSRGLLALIMALQVLAYFSAKFMEFRLSGPFVEEATGRVVGFWEYFHFTTITMSMEEAGKEPTPLGPWGYFVRTGEVAGFSLGALILPLLMRAKPHRELCDRYMFCEPCERYMKSQSLALLPAGIKKASLWGNKATALTPAEALEAGMAEVAELVTLAGEGNTNVFREKLAQHAPGEKAAAQLDRRIDVRLVACEQCGSGQMMFFLIETAGRQVQAKQIGQVKLSRDFVREMAACRAG